MTSASRRAPASVLIALGSNLGDRAGNLLLAVRGMTEAALCVSRLSSIYETAPVSEIVQPPFLNMVAAGWTRLDPAELLGELQAIETRLGRRRTIRNAPRTIDLDLILYSAVAMRTDRLTLPHPRFREREFVLQPLRELELPWAV